MTYFANAVHVASTATATLATLAAVATLPSGSVVAQSTAPEPPVSTEAVDAGRERLTPTATSLANAAHVLDLTHTLNADFPFIPIPDITYGFSSRPIATLDTLGTNANEWRIHEHLGTQIDAPIHFSRNGRTLEQIRLDELIRPVVVIDHRQPSEANVDAEVTPADIQAWEATNGPIPQGAVVMINFGWSRHIGTPRYLGLDEEGHKHFPGVSVEAANWLVRERDVWGVGVDTISFDPGRDEEYRTHKALLGADRWALEAVANLDRLPATGATLIIGAPKVEAATGGIVRLIAVW